MPDAAICACEAVAGRLESSMSPTQMAELAATPAAGFNQF
jgi:hypothetical protein